MKLNGTIMSQDHVAATVKDGIITTYDEKYLPLYLSKTKDVEGWLMMRAIDRHRTNSRLLRRALRIAATDDLSAVLRVHAKTITDTYWIKQDGENLRYADVIFRENRFDKLALYGDADSFDRKYSPTPELTNTGSFEKCWRLIDGVWWMYKSGRSQELFSELFLYEFGKRLGFRMAEYELDGDYIRSRDFTDAGHVNFEAAMGLVLEEEDYQINYQVFRKISKEMARDYIKMIYLDSLCNNMDRHTQNYGVLRHPDTGKFLQFAPLFDHNIVLISTSVPSMNREKNRLITLFTGFLNQNPEAMELFCSLELPRITESLIQQCCDRVPVTADREFIARYILKGESVIRHQLRRITG